HAMTESCDQRHPFGVAGRLWHRVERSERPERHPEIARLLEESLEPGLRGADDLESMTAKRHAAADDARIATDTALLGRMSENDDRDSAIVRQEQSPERGVNA